MTWIIDRQGVVRARLAVRGHRADTLTGRVAAAAARRGQPTARTRGSGILAPEAAAPAHVQNPLPVRQGPPPRPPAAQLGRGDPGGAARRAHGPHHGRRGPRERGRPHHGGRARDARGGGLHDPPHQRHHLRADGGGAAGAAGTAADGAGQQRVAPHRLHRLGGLCAPAPPPACPRADRAATIRALADPPLTAADFARPGHIFPLRPRRGGVLVRAGHTEAAVDLCRLAGLQAGRRAVRGHERRRHHGAARRSWRSSRARHELKIGTIADLIRYRLRNERSVERISEQTVQTELGEFRLYAYEDRVQSRACTWRSRAGALDGPEAPLVRVHVPDTLRDLLGVRGDARAWTLRAALQRIVEAGNGVVVILRAAGVAARARRRGARLAPAPASRSQRSARRQPPQREGAVLRTFGVGAQILKDLGVSACACCRRPSRCTASRPSIWRSRATSGKRRDAARAACEGEVSARGRRVAIVAARFNDFIVVEPARRARSPPGSARRRARGPARRARARRLRAAGRRAQARRSGRYDAVVALGCVIRGDTPHFDYVAGECARGLQQASLETGVPVVFGVLTVETVEQALERAATGAGNKGGEAMETRARDGRPDGAAVQRARRWSGTDRPARASGARSWPASWRCRRCTAGSSTTAPGRTWCRSSRDAEDMPRADREYFRELVEGVWHARAALDAELAAWMDREPRAARPDRARGAADRRCTSSRRGPRCRSASSINEAVSLAKRFGATDGHKFVNAVLDRAARELRPDEH